MNNNQTRNFTTINSLMESQSFEQMLMQNNISDEQMAELVCRDFPRVRNATPFNNLKLTIE